jgi:hypothetical protein
VVVADHARARREPATELVLPRSIDAAAPWISRIAGSRRARRSVRRSTPLARDLLARHDTLLFVLP